MNETLTRHWCQTWARRLEVQHIQRNGAPYLERYFVAGWNPTTRQPGPAIFLHHFVASDAEDQVHSHPWAFSISLILVGGYRELRCQSTGPPLTREFRPGDVNVLDAEARHRIDLLELECWTLFLVGDVARDWRFTPPC